MAAAAETSGHMSIEGNSIGTTEVGDILRGVLHNWEMHNGSTITILPDTLLEDRFIISGGLARQLKGPIDQIQTKRSNESIAQKKGHSERSRYHTSGAGTSNNVNSSIKKTPSMSVDDMKRIVDSVVNSLLGQSDVSEDIQLMDQGLDSLGAMELSTRLSKELGVKLSSTFVFNYPRKQDIYDYMREYFNLNL
jgi:acyl carrier protein